MNKHNNIEINASSTAVTKEKKKKQQGLNKKYLREEEVRFQILLRQLSAIMQASNNDLNKDPLDITLRGDDGIMIYDIEKRWPKKEVKAETCFVDETEDIIKLGSDILSFWILWKKTCTSKVCDIWYMLDFFHLVCLFVRN